MGQQHIQTRVPDDLADRIDTYQEHEEYMNDAEALRALLRAGLDAEGYAEDGVDDDPTDGTDTGERAGFESTAPISGRMMDIGQIILLSVILLFVAGVL